ncbi:hypothetical protein Vadar_023275 [Vaccinium darrowii]|uniref:Uncharacterized protein n=1 Tax=Vaccinium darrowii TaxID=229202 RepID=A0ACB7ZDJ8_9ERIC|nr:hypothetical protein Vadar_023275 [Vaccinium darrowii]
MTSSLETLTSTAESQNSGHFQFEPGPNKDISLCSQDQEYAENVKEVQVYLDKLKKIVRPGCSQEVLNIALGSMSSIVGTLSMMSSKPKPRASL